MAMAHSYAMTAREGSEDALGAALEALASAVKGIAGSQGALVLNERKEPQKFLFVELWDSDESRKGAGPLLPKEVMGAIMAALGGPLQATDYARLGE